MRTFSFVLIIFSIFVNTSTRAHAALKIGQAAPHLVAPILDGSEFSMGAQAGKVVIIHFLATWCTACTKEMPILNQFYVKHKKDVIMIGLSLDRPRDRKKVSELMHEVSFPLAMLNEAKTNEFGSPDTLPLTYLIDQQGLVRVIYGAGFSDLNDNTLTDAYNATLRPKVNK